VRNGVDHDARVLRAARVAQRTLGGSALVIGVATASAPAGEARVEGVPVLRLPAHPPHMRRLTGIFGKSASATPPREQERTRAPTLDPHLPSSAPQLTPVGRARRTLSGLSFTLQALSVARRAKPRLVHANDWNTMWAGLLVKLLWGSRLVYDSHELWGDRNGRWEWRPWLLACEALFVRAADEVLTSSPGYADALAARYHIPRPSVVRNIPESPRASPPSRPAAPLVVYIGGLMPGRGLEQMIDALPLIPTVRLRAVGPGASLYRGSLLTRAQAAGVLDRVDLRSPVPPAEVPAALAGAIAGLCLIQPICRSYELCLPNKLFEYTAAGVPVLASDLPVIGALVRSEGFGALAPPTDPHAIAAALGRLLEPEGWRLASERAQAFAETHSWAAEARTLEDTYRRTQAGAQDRGIPAHTQAETQYTGIPAHTQGGTQYPGIPAHTQAETQYPGIPAHTQAETQYPGIPAHTQAETQYPGIPTHTQAETQYPGIPAHTQAETQYTGIPAHTQGGTRDAGIPA
jgi:glycosyltransferase involved in cell wall biosynthesis